MTKKIKYSLIAVLSVVAVAAAGFGVYRYFHKPGEITSVEHEFEEEQTKEETTAGASAGISIPGYKEVDLVAGTLDQEVELTNPEVNNVYFEISFYLPETDETIYTSKLIKPGQSLYDITLDKTLDAGEYDLTIIYTTYAMDDEYSPRNGAEVNCKLVVE